MFLYVFSLGDRVGFAPEPGPKMVERAADWGPWYRDQVAAFVERAQPGDYTEIGRGLVVCLREPA